MRPVNDLELGLMYWATEDPQKDIDFVQSFGLQAGQLGIGGDLALFGLAGRWQAALAKNPDFAIPTAVCSYAGEDYTDIAAVQQTVGLVPEGTRIERIARTKQVADLAADLGIRSVACHIGFVPEDRSSVTYIRMCNIVRDICDHMQTYQQDFTLETGQESAFALLDFIEDVSRPNLKINFDPANMILYGTGDPIEAVRILAPYVTSVHCKDGEPPPPEQPGRLGTERALGAGRVNFPTFLQTLRDIGYRGILSVEREEPDAVQRTADIRHAVQFLRALLVNGSEARTPQRPS